jgi:cyclase
MVRIIARMDIKGRNLIKGVQLEGLRVIGDPIEYAEMYYNQNADELIYMDSVASLYERKYVVELIKKTAERVFIPITVSGGIKTVQDVELILRSGADKVAINTAAVKNPTLIKEVSEKFGRQCMVLQIDTKKTKLGYEVYIDGGREKTGIDVLEWAKKGIDFGCGEIILTSIDRDGTKKGFDVELFEKMSAVADVPLIASGGMSTLSHLNPIVENNFANGVAIGTAFHYKMYTPIEIKKYLGYG